MNLASVMKRAKENREDWVYTDLERFGEAFNDIVTPRSDAGSSSAASAAHISPVARYRSPLDPGFCRGDELREANACITFINGNYLPGASNMSGLPDGFIKGSAEEGYVISVADKTCLVTTPVELHFINHGQAKEINTKIRIELGENCRCTLIETFDGAGPIHILEKEIKLSPQAKLVHGKILAQKDVAPAHFSFADVKVCGGAYYDSFVLLSNGSLTRDETEVSLLGPMAQCNLRGIMLLAGKSHIDTTTRIRHIAPECASRQVYKTVATDAARGVFQGKVVVEKNAQKSDGYQLSRALLLSDRAEVDAKPELEINADDVKCSHGSTIGDIDEQALFYLRSRGIGERDARALLIKAFVDELVNEVGELRLREFMQKEVERWLEDVQEI